MIGAGSTSYQLMSHLESAKILIKTGNSQQAISELQGELRNTGNVNKRVWR
jgi:hypothetical protein